MRNSSDTRGEKLYVYSAFSQRMHSEGNLNNGNAADSSLNVNDGLQILHYKIYISTLRLSPGEFGLQSSS